MEWVIRIIIRIVTYYEKGLFYKMYKDVLTEIYCGGGCPRGVMVKAMDCGIVVHYYVHFRTNTLGKGMNFLILPAMG